MKKNSIHLKSKVIFLVVIFSLSLSAFAQKNVSSEIQKENDAFRTAFANGNIDALAAKYTIDAVLLPPNSEPVTGPESIAKIWEGTKGMGVSDIVFKTESAELHGNVAIEQGNYKLFANENMMIDQGKYIVIWEKQKGKWLIRKDIWNTSNPSPPKDHGQ